jgi:cysteine desulfurase
MLPKVKPAKKPIYLDYAATTPLDRRVFNAMRPFLTASYGNPSSLYKQGREALAAINEARQDIANIINAKPQEIVFTAGGTESINLAIFGTARHYELTHQNKGHIIASSIEHPAVLESLTALKREGWKTTLVGVDDQGFIKLKELKKSILSETVLISLMYANNEIGTIQPLAQIGNWLRKLNTERTKKNLPPVLFHTDAAQAAGTLNINVNHLGVDLLSANGSKMYGPKQTGFLYIRSGVTLRPLIYGGGQEKSLRSGTENVAGAVGLAKALEIGDKLRDKENKRVLRLRDYFIDQLFKRIEIISLNGPRDQRLPNNINVSIAGVEGEVVMLYLDSYNIAVSTGSACSSASADPSHVLLALGKSKEQAKGSLRFTLGRTTTKQELDYTLRVLTELVKELRKIKNK